MSQFRLVQPWAERPDQRGVWMAVGESYPDAPFMVMEVRQQENTRWQYQVWYAYDPGEKWTQDGFQAPEGAMAGAELKVDRLQGGGGR